MNSSSGRAGAPCCCTHSLKALHISKWVLRYWSINAGHGPLLSCAYPENVGAMPGPLISRGLQETTRTNGAPEVIRAGKHRTLSSTTTSGLTRPTMAFSCGSQYIAPSIRACQVGLTKVSNCSMVGFRNSGAVSRMKSFQNCPASWSSPSAGGGAKSTKSSTKPKASSFPFHDDSAANTTRWPRCNSLCPRPMHWFVGP